MMLSLEMLQSGCKIPNSKDEAWHSYRNSESIQDWAQEWFFHIELGVEFSVKCCDAPK